MLVIFHLRGAGRLFVDQEVKELHSSSSSGFPGRASEGRQTHPDAYPWYSVPPIHNLKVVPRGETATS